MKNGQFDENGQTVDYSSDIQQYLDIYFKLNNVRIDLKKCATVDDFAQSQALKAKAEKFGRIILCPKTLPGLIRGLSEDPSAIKYELVIETCKKNCKTS